MFGLEGGIILALLGYFGYILRDIPNTLWQIIIPRVSYSVSFISSDTNIYNIGNSWIQSFDSKLLKRNMQITTLSYLSGQTTKTINYGEYYFFIDPLTFIHISKTLLEKNQYTYDRIFVRIIGKNQKKYIEDLIRLADELYPKESVFFKCSAHTGIHVKKKYFEDIFTPGKEQVISALETWLKNKEVYDRHGIQYKMGILLYGLPGTGKSSIARAIAAYLDWDMACIDLKSSTSYELIDWITRVGKKKVVILEDIDCVVSNRESNDSQIKENANFETLLNILDGSLSPNEVIFVATTNYIDRLDKAFIRDGRFDCKVELKNLSLENAKEMCAAYGVDAAILENEELPINPAYLQNKLLAATKLKSH